MFFKNLILYRLKSDWKVSLDQFEDQLGRGKFIPCPSNVPVSRGWSSPVGENGPLVFNSNKQWLIALDIEVRQLPSSVVKAEVAERAKKIEDERGYAVGRKELRELKERVTAELLPRAFKKKSRTYAWIDTVNRTLAIDAGSPAKADQVIEHLRHCLDDVPLTLIHTQISAVTAMSDWLAGADAPANFTLDMDCELKAADETKATVRYTRHNLDTEEVRQHLAAGKLPTRLALTWNDRISLVLTDKGQLKKLGFLDMLKEEAEQSAAEADDLFEASFAIMSGELGRLIPDFIAALGGEMADEE